MKIMPFHTINLNTDVDIYLMKGILMDIGAIVRSYVNSDKLLIVSDDNVSLLYGVKVVKYLKMAGFEVELIDFKAGESSKNMDTINSLYSSFVSHSITRNDCIIALGGGVVGDVVGFAASTYMRGINYIQIPTTFLAQIDSSIGGKTGVDLPYGKNLAGSFYQPKAIIIDPDFLETLDDEIFNDGIAEALKYGLIRDKWIYDKLVDEYSSEDLIEIIERSVMIKAKIVQEDEFESNLRMILNFGHTYGHAIEKCMNYTNISHGVAVGIGMVMALKMGEIKCITQAGLSDNLIKVLRKYNMPTSTDIPIQDLNKAILSDKKRAGDKINFVLINDIGRAVVVKIPISELEGYTYE